MKQIPVSFNSTLKRSPMRRVRKVKTEHVGVFDLVLPSGRVWPHWPAMNLMSEKEWDNTCLEWAFKLGGCLKTWHCETGDDSRSSPGWFDRIYFFKGRAVVVEHKVRYANGKANDTSPWQKEYIAAAFAAGWDPRVWTWPDDHDDAWLTLTGLPLEKSPYYRTSWKAVS